MVCKRLLGKFPRLRLLWADGGYAGQLVGWMAFFGGWVPSVVKRNDAVKGFVVLPRR
jgi:putative transposase